MTLGKSQTLIQLVDHWLELDPDAQGEIGFEGEVNINQVVVVSYSPFELFPLSSKASDEDDGTGRKDHDVYRYFGLRMPTVFTDDAGQEHTGVRLSRDWPRRNAALSLIDCLADDQKYGAIKSWSAKVATLCTVLGTAIDFDHVAIGVRGYEDKRRFFVYKPWVDDIIEITTLVENDGLPDAYVTIRPDGIDELHVDELRQFVHERSGIVFLKNGEPVELSSGQRLFSYIVANILGAMRRNSLILIDEPELFLHPTLEISFIRMLKQILASYGSKALLATHSLVTVRELPRDCVHVVERTEDGVFVKHPPFETFGGDIQRISSYVFGDKSVSKPFEEWLSEKLREYGSAKALIQALGPNINEEMLIQINAMDEGKW